MLYEVITSNLKAQTWWHLRDRFYNAYKCREGMDHDPDMLISLDASELSDKVLAKLCAELAQPRREYLNGVITSYSIHYTKLYDLKGHSTSSWVRSIDSFANGSTSVFFSISMPSWWFKCDHMPICTECQWGSNECIEQPKISNSWPDYPLLIQIIFVSAWFNWYLCIYSKYSPSFIEIHIQT